jgi:phosphinothricin acetyltransferase
LVVAAIIRFAAPDDAQAVRAIYAPYCGDSPVSFEIVPPSVDEMRGRISRTMERFPWLLCQRGDVVAGYVYATGHRDRAAYQWSVEVTAYIHQQYYRAGLGRALYTALFQLLRAQGYVTAYAGITLPNPASVALHSRMGFEPVGVYKSVGFKCGSWQDVGWWRLLLQPPPRQPAPPQPYQNLDPLTVAKILEQGSALLNC